MPHISQTMSYSTQAIINLDAIRHNLQQVKSLAPQAKIMAVVKADAYGHGLIETATALAMADGLAVARLEEALQLRATGTKQRILLLGGYTDNDCLQHCAQQHIDVVVHSTQGVEQLLSAKLTTPINVWLKHDSGMHRLGMDDGQYQGAYAQLATCSQVNEIILMTHFSESDENNKTITQTQLQRFQQVTAEINAPRSLANSAAILQHPDTHADWVRPGIMLYGANPLATPEHAAVELIPAMSFSTKVIALRNIAAGESVGYLSRWTAKRASRIATLSVGYGDGYPRHAENGTPVKVNGQLASLVGTVSMDLITIDVTDCHNINLGDSAYLWGNGLKAEVIAQHVGTISYELFTSVTKRVFREYY